MSVIGVSVDTENHFEKFFHHPHVKIVFPLQACPAPTPRTPWCRTAPPRPSACTAGSRQTSTPWATTATSRWLEPSIALCIAYPACVIAVPRVEGGAGISPVVKIALITNCPCVLRAVIEPLRSFSVPGEGAYWDLLLVQSAYSGLLRTMCNFAKVC